MPAGTCTVCGCTEAHPCEGGCSWVGEEQTHCSQCVCWAVLVRPNPYEGILPYDLMPVRTLHPTRANNPSGLAYPVDQRRIDPDDRRRLAFVLAPRLGITVEEFLECWETRGFDASAIPAEKVAMVQVAPDAASAAARVAEFWTTGTVKGGREIHIAFPVYTGKRMGGPRRG